MGLLIISALANQWGYPLQCGKEYSIKLAVSNNCVSWHEVKKTILIRCIENIAPVNDIIVCCNKIHPITLGDNNNPSNYSYSWISDPTGLVPSANVNDMSFTITPTQSSIFTVTVTDDFGCEAKFKNRVIIEQDFNISVAVNKIGCCSYELVPTINFIGGCHDEGWTSIKKNLLNYTWSDGYNGAIRTIASPQNTTLTLYVNNSCFGHNTTVTIPKLPMGGFPQVIAPNAMRPSSPIPVNRVLTIAEFGINAPNAGDPAYNAKSYKLLIFDRWGNVIRTIEKNACELLQREIVWDGKNDNGNTVPLGVYIWKLYLKNCTYNQWMPVCQVFGTGSSIGICNDYCFKWWPLPPHTECCGEWTDACAYSITVVQ